MQSVEKKLVNCTSVGIKFWPFGVSYQQLTLEKELKKKSRPINWILPFQQKMDTHPDKFHLYFHKLWFKNELSSDQKMIPA